MATMLNNTEVDLNKEKSLDYARLGPFLTSFARRQLYPTFKAVEQDVYCVHTDGGVMSKTYIKKHFDINISSIKSSLLKVELPMDGVGEWKVEKGVHVRW